MDPNSRPMAWTSGQGPLLGPYNAFSLLVHGSTLIIHVAGNPNSTPIIAHINANSEFSVIKTTVARRLATTAHPIPQQYSIMIPQVGLVTPEEWVTVTCDIPEMGVEGMTVNLQMADWEDPLVHMYIGRRFLSQLPREPVSPEATDYRSPPGAQSNVAALSAAAQRPPPQMILNGATAVESPESVMAQYGNNTPPMPVVNSFLGASSAHQLQVPDSYPSFAVTHGTADFDCSSSWAPISAPSNIFSLGTFPTSSVTSGDRANYSHEDSNTTALPQNGGDATYLSFDADNDYDADHDYDGDYDYDMLNAQDKAGDGPFGGRAGGWPF
ncbi:hypothetical protein QBC41DRAFT_322801 [Cercophora samala]|uniref:Uncharacterized protein n=1 Tax=Cercophora samala TaxID=330535 RepID=A0AA39ZBL2_9PEZI|nr:hypothetical protein QBC41DRAFT_322801 [Cercophora samala]